MSNAAAGGDGSRRQPRRRLLRRSRQPRRRTATGFTLASSTAGRSGFGLSIVRQAANAYGWDVPVTDGAMAVAGVFSAAQIETLTTAYTWLFMVAFAGLGYELDVSEMRGVGTKPLLLMLVALCTISAVSLLTISALF